MEFTEEKIKASYENYFYRRADLGLSDNEVSIKAKVDRETFCKWHRGLVMPTVKSLYKIANACECKVSDFLCG